MNAVPLPLGIHDIDSYLHSRPILIDRPEFEACIFALDDAYRNDWAESQKTKA